MKTTTLSEVAGPCSTPLPRLLALSRAVHRHRPGIMPKPRFQTTDHAAKAAHPAPPEAGLPARHPPLTVRASFPTLLLSRKARQSVMPSHNLDGKSGEACLHPAGPGWCLQGQSRRVRVEAVRRDDGPASFQNGVSNGPPCPSKPHILSTPSPALPHAWVQLPAGPCWRPAARATALSLPSTTAPMPTSSWDTAAPAPR